VLVLDNPEPEQFSQGHPHLPVRPQDPIPHLLARTAPERRDMKFLPLLDHLHRPG
jgi:hypothetical protein